MEQGYTLVGISASEYQAVSDGQKLIQCRVPNYYYKLDIVGTVFFIDSNSDSLAFLLEELRSSRLLLLALDDRLYIFSTETGKINLTVRTFHQIINYKISEEFIFVFTEKMMLSILINNCVFHSSHMFSDTITDIQVQKRSVTVKCFDGRTFNLHL